VILEVRNNVLPLLLLSLDDALMIVLQVLVLVLVFACEYLVFVEDKVGSSEVIFIDGFRFETNNLLLNSEG
jgi:hypothetical protein